MKGKFRKRSSAIWCPKPSMKVDLEKCRELRFQGKMDYNKIPMKPKKVTGWTNMIKCEICEFMEEFQLDNDGVFCLYGIK